MAKKKLKYFSKKARISKKILYFCTREIEMVP